MSAMAAHTDKSIVSDKISRCGSDEPTSSGSVITNVCIIKQPVLRKNKPIPPPLDLSKRGLLDDPNEDHLGEHTCFSSGFSVSPRSPASASQKHLPFRKRAFSWTTFHDDSACHSLSPGPSSAVIQRGTYSSFIPTSPHVSRLTVIKQESVEKSDALGEQPEVDYSGAPEEPQQGLGDPVQPQRGFCKTVINYPVTPNPAFPTPATPSPLSPMNFAHSASFFPSHFQPKLSSYSWSGSLLSPAPSLTSSSQEELAQCRGSWKYEDNDVAESPSSFPANRDDIREDYLHNEPQPGTSELCERLQRFDFVAPSGRNSDKRVTIVAEDTTSSLAPSPAKRPMNGFMLFAQKYRLQLIQQYPGRDNRAISVMLGDAWKRLNPAEKEVYTAEAHLRAEEYRRLFPDCWKRKRSKSTS